MKYTVENILGSFFRGEVRRYSLNEIPEILYRMKRGELSREQLISIVSTRYQIAHFFEEMLREMIRIIERGTFREGTWPLKPYAIEELRKAAAVNLSEELGEVKEYGGPHREGREVFLTTLGVDYKKWKSVLGTYDNIGEIDPGARTFLLRMKWIISLGAVEAISALWYYENRISLDHVHGDYHILLHAFEEKFPEFKKPGGKYQEGDALWHIYSHADHDEHHANLAKNALKVIEGRGFWHESIENGVHETMKATDYFWCELSEKFLGRFFTKDHWSFAEAA